LVPFSLASNLDRARFGDVERLALRRAFGDVEEDNVAQFLQCGEMGERAADLTEPIKRNLVPRQVMGIAATGSTPAPTNWRTASR
jgi:hypothetical protein